MKFIQGLALFLAILGAINWGLVSIFDFNLVEYVFDGMDEIYSQVVYALVGVSGIICLTIFSKLARR